MASASELRKNVEQSYAALRTAIEGASGSRWMAARPSAESVLRSELECALSIAETMEALRPPERKQFTLESREQALAALTEVAATCTKVFSYVEDRDLVKRTSYMGNIGGALEAAAQQASGSATAIQAAS